MINQLYQQRLTQWSDIQHHMPTLRKLASHCQMVAEFGVREGNSTVALLAGLEDGGGYMPRLISYDINPPATEAQDITAALDWPRIKWDFYLTDTATAEIPTVDMLFIDTLHTYAHVIAELRPEVTANVRHYIAFHDTVLFRGRDENHSDGMGILIAILERLAADGCWRLKHHNNESHGLTVFERV